MPLLRRPWISCWDIRAKGRFALFAGRLVRSLVCLGNLGEVPARGEGPHPSSRVKEIKRLKSDAMRHQTNLKPTNEQTNKPTNQQTNEQTLKREAPWASLMDALPTPFQGAGGRR